MTVRTKRSARERQVYIREASEASEVLANEAELVNARHCREGNPSSRGVLWRGWRWSTTSSTRTPPRLGTSTHLYTTELSINSSVSSLSMRPMSDPVIEHTRSAVIALSRVNKRTSGGTLHRGNPGGARQSGDYSLRVPGGKVQALRLPHLQQEPSDSHVSALRGMVASFVHRRRLLLACCLRLKKRS